MTKKIDGQKTDRKIKTTENSGSQFKRKSKNKGKLSYIITVSATEGYAAHSKIIHTSTNSSCYKKLLELKKTIGL